VVRVPDCRSGGPGFDSLALQEKKVVGLEQSPLSLVSTTESYLEEIVAAPVWKGEKTAVGIRRADYATPLYPQKLALTSLTNGGRSVGIVCLRTEAKELFFIRQKKAEQDTHEYVHTTPSEWDLFLLKLATQQCFQCGDHAESNDRMNK
jgi:hypothetical protein